MLNGVLDSRSSREDWDSTRGRISGGGEGRLLCRAVRWLDSRQEGRVLGCVVGDQLCSCLYHDYGEDQEDGREIDFW